MKLQHLAVIFIIIILPISLILTTYIQSTTKTLSIQTSYDAKLNNATYDALKAFQLNTINSDTSDIANSKLRDIEASVNTFFTSIASNFNMVGYNEDILKNYVPALVYTMYDGYYIYSPYTNKLDSTNKIEVTNEDGSVEEKNDAEILEGNADATYRDGDKLTGLKPYVFYSCRYKSGTSDDFVITYSLDNYIVIEGKIGNKNVYDSGYLLSLNNVNADGSEYRNVAISNDEETKEYIDSNTNEKNEYEYIKINGAKYYKDTDGSWFTIINGEKFKQSEKFGKNIAGKLYYKEAYDFTQRVLNEYNLTDLKPSDAVDENGNQIKDEFGNNKFGDYNIFDDDDKSIEDFDSNFNQHRLEVIRYSIEKNLSIAIANYNNYSNVTTNFQMPKLKEDEWDKVLNNISIISFLQGLNIGGKVYNGYSIIPNTKNKENVDEDSIYITYNGQYYKPTDITLLNYNTGTFQGVLNLDFERKTKVDENGNSVYFLPHKELASYSSIVNNTNVEYTDNMYEFMAKINETNPNLASAYFTALGREKYSLYKTNNKLEEIKRKFL